MDAQSCKSHVGAGAPALTCMLRPKQLADSRGLLSNLSSLQCMLNDVVLYLVPLRCCWRSYGIPQLPRHTETHGLSTGPGSTQQPSSHSPRSRRSIQHVAQHHHRMYVIHVPGTDAEMRSLDDSIIQLLLDGAVCVASLLDGCKQ
jgi:hypothetical protein